MSDQQTWVEALNINPELLVEWSAQAPARKPILVHCIEQGLVDYGEYMRWAQERYGLPILQANYFQATFDSSLLDHEKLSGAWHPWIYPVDRWENITYIACVEPPQEPESPDVRYVLADPRAMRDAWGGTATTIRPLNKVDSFSPPPVPSTPVAEAEMPNGLTTSPKPFVLDLDHATFNIGPVNTVAAPPAKLTVVPSATEIKPEIKPTPKPAAKTEITAAGATDEEGALDILFARLRERYTASLVMKCRDQNAKLYKWDPSLTPSDQSKTTVNLSYPTFMRILAKTNLPYHGYLVDSPAHHEFFAALGIEKLPVCVTAIPVRFENFLWGMIVAFGNEQNQKMDSLNFAQEATEKLVSAVGIKWSKAS